jgi:molybdopterin molybdotransferase
MLTVEEALDAVLRHASPRPAATVALADALGLALAEDVVSDIDSPPHDKSMVDGYAVVAEDLAGGSAELAILEEVVAGAVPTLAVARGAATRIMTGAPIPDGADAVVMIEHAQVLPAADSDLGRVRLHSQAVSSGQNILARAAAMHRGDVVLTAGAVIRPIEMGLLAEVGCARLQAIPRPAVAILSTGNELVPPDASPGPGQIRNSNGPMLVAAVRQAGGVPIDLGIGRDDRQELARLIARGLESDLLVLSGGVSAGVLDRVPGVLAELGVERVFHQVRLKPGKPLWFGVLRDDAGYRLVFGLPGNPVSSLVCFELFVRPALEHLAGMPPASRRVAARLKEPYAHRGNRPTWHPAVIEAGGDAYQVRPLVWQGSADLRALAAANALASFPAGDRQYAAGEAITCQRL